MKIRLITLLATAFLVIGHLGVSQASIVLDQYQTEVDHGYFLASGVTRWQEFKPTLGGLERIDLLLQRGPTGTYGDVIIELKDALEQTVWSSVIADASIPTGEGWLTVDTPLLSLTPENVYKIELTGTWSSWPFGEALAWKGSHTSSYDRGVSGIALSLEDDYDYAFKTYAIPEPASLGLLGLVTGGIYFTRRFFVV